jgi:hypothetical protein
MGVDIFWLVKSVRIMLCWNRQCTFLNYAGPFWKFYSCSKSSSILRPTCQIPLFSKTSLSRFSFMVLKKVTQGIWNDDFLYTNHWEHQLKSPPPTLLSPWGSLGQWKPVCHEINWYFFLVFLDSCHGIKNFIYIQKYISFLQTCMPIPIRPSAALSFYLTLKIV